MPATYVPSRVEEFSSALSGILQVSAGVIVATTPGVEYLAPNGSGAALTGVVHTTGTESVAGAKTFTGLVRMDSSYGGFAQTNSGPFDLAVSCRHRRTLDGTNGSLSLANFSATDQVLHLVLTQGGAGSNTVTWWGGITWAGSGAAPTLETAVGRQNLITVLKTGASSYFGIPVAVG